MEINYQIFETTRVEITSLVSHKYQSKGKKKRMWLSFEIKLEFDLRIKKNLGIKPSRYKLGCEKVISSF
jgi:hypothetical protein